MAIQTIEEIAGTAGRMMGVDFGDKRTGLAISDESRFLASGIGCISPGGLAKTAERVAQIVRERNVRAVVVGLPVNMDGSLGSRADRCREFAETLSALFDGALPVCLFDERLTTVAATRFLNETNTRGAKRKEVVDTLSAQIILQNSLDRIKNMR